jgi:hypothetical protein
LDYRVPFIRERRGPAYLNMDFMGPIVAATIAHMGKKLCQREIIKAS